MRILKLCLLMNLFALNDGTTVTSAGLSTSIQMLLLLIGVGLRAILVVNLAVTT